jgi:hypothetical protein
VFTVNTDASNMQIGCRLSPVHEGQQHAAAHYSRTLSIAERNYCMTWQESLAILKMVKHFYN